MREKIYSIATPSLLSSKNYAIKTPLWDKLVKTYRVSLNIVQPFTESDKNYPIQLSPISRLRGYVDDKVSEVAELQVKEVSTTLARYYEGTRRDEKGALLFTLHDAITNENRIYDASIFGDANAVRLLKIMYGSSVIEDIESTLLQREQETYIYEHDIFKGPGILADIPNFILAAVKQNEYDVKHTSLENASGDREWYTLEDQIDLALIMSNEKFIQILQNEEFSTYRDFMIDIADGTAASTDREYGMHISETIAADWFFKDILATREDLQLVSRVVEEFDLRLQDSDVFYRQNNQDNVVYINPYLSNLKEREFDGLEVLYALSEVSRPEFATVHTSLVDVNRYIPEHAASEADFYLSQLDSREILATDYFIESGNVLIKEFDTYFYEMEDANDNGYLTYFHEFDVFYKDVETYDSRIVQENLQAEFYDKEFTGVYTPMYESEFVHKDITALVEETIEVDRNVAPLFAAYTTFTDSSIIRSDFATHVLEFSDFDALARPEFTTLLHEVDNFYRVDDTYEFSLHENQAADWNDSEVLIDIAKLDDTVLQIHEYDLNIEDSTLASRNSDKLMSIAQTDSFNLDRQRTIVIEESQELTITNDYVMQIVESIAAEGDSRYSDIFLDEATMFERLANEFNSSILEFVSAEDSGVDAYRHEFFEFDRVDDAFTGVIDVTQHATKERPEDIEIISSIAADLSDTPIDLNMHSLQRFIRETDYTALINISIRFDRHDIHDTFIDEFYEFGNVAKQAILSPDFDLFNRRDTWDSRIADIDDFTRIMRDATLPEEFHLFDRIMRDAVIPEQIEWFTRVEQQATIVDLDWFSRIEQYGVIDDLDWFTRVEQYATINELDWFDRTIKDFTIIETIKVERNMVYNSTMEEFTEFFGPDPREYTWLWHSRPQWWSKWNWTVTK